MKIINAEPYGYSSIAIGCWNKAGYEYQESSWRQIDEANNFPEVEVLIVRLNRFIGAVVLDKFPFLKLIVTATTGLDHLDLVELKRRHIQVVSLKNEREFLDSIPSTAEHTWAMLMSLLRNIPSAIQSVSQGNWDRDAFRGYQLMNKTLGVIGMGRTGSKVGTYAMAFGMRVIFYDPFIEFSQLGHKCSKLEQLLEESDFITLHVHLNKETRSLINQTNVISMKRRPYLVNTSRGQIWDEKAIVDGLLKGTIAGVATDVLSTELTDITKSPLWNAQKKGYPVLITPHIGGATWDAMKACEEYIASKTISRVL